MLIVESIQESNESVRVAMTLHKAYPMQTTELLSMLETLTALMVADELDEDDMSNEVAWMRERTEDVHKRVQAINRHLGIGPPNFTIPDMDE